jgi:hypothetical protein
MVDTQEIKMPKCKCGNQASETNDTIVENYTSEGNFYTCGKCSFTWPILSKDEQIESLSLQLAEVRGALKLAVDRQGFNTEEFINACKILRRK